MVLHSNFIWERTLKDAPKYPAQPFESLLPKKLNVKVHGVL